MSQDRKGQSVTDCRLCRLQKSCDFWTPSKVSEIKDQKCRCRPLFLFCCWIDFQGFSKLLPAATIQLSAAHLQHPHGMESLLLTNHVTELGTLERVTKGLQPRDRQYWESESKSNSKRANQTHHISAFTVTLMGHGSPRTNPSPSYHVGTLGLSLSPFPRPLCMQNNLLWILLAQHLGFVLKMKKNKQTGEAQLYKTGKILTVAEGWYWFIILAVCWKCSYARATKYKSTANVTQFLKSIENYISQKWWKSIVWRCLRLYLCLETVDNFSFFRYFSNSLWWAQIISIIWIWAWYHKITTKRLLGEHGR